MICFCPEIQWDIFILSRFLFHQYFSELPKNLRYVFFYIMVKLNIAKYKITFDLQLCSSACIVLILAVIGTNVCLSKEGLGF